MHEPMSSHSLFRSHALAAHAQMNAGLLQLAQAHGATQQRKAWQLLEAAWLDHLRDEEELLLPDFSLSYPSEAARIRGEHERIRQLLVRASDTSNGAQHDDHVLKDLIRLARDCAGYEERMLYPWAEQRLRPTKKGEFLQRTRRHAHAGGAV